MFSESSNYNDPLLQNSLSYNFTLRFPPQNRKVEIIFYQKEKTLKSK